MPGCNIGLRLATVVCLFLPVLVFSVSPDPEERLQLFLYNTKSEDVEASLEGFPPTVPVQSSQNLSEACTRKDVNREDQTIHDEIMIQRIYSQKERLSFLKAGPLEVLGSFLSSKPRNAATLAMNAAFPQMCIHLIGTRLRLWEEIQCQPDTWLTKEIKNRIEENLPLFGGLSGVKVQAGRAEFTALEFVICLNSAADHAKTASAFDEAFQEDAEGLEAVRKVLKRLPVTAVLRLQEFVVNNEVPHPDSWKSVAVEASKYEIEVGLKTLKEDRTAETAPIWRLRVGPLCFKEEAQKKGHSLAIVADALVEVDALKSAAFQISRKTLRRASTALKEMSYEKGNLVRQWMSRLVDTRERTLKWCRDTRSLLMTSALGVIEGDVGDEEAQKEAQTIEGVVASMRVQIAEEAETGREEMERAVEAKHVSDGEETNEWKRKFDNCRENLLERLFENYRATQLLPACQSGGFGFGGR